MLLRTVVRTNAKTRMVYDVVQVQEVISMASIICYFESIAQRSAINVALQGLVRRRLISDYTHVDVPVAPLLRSRQARTTCSRPIIRMIRTLGG